MYYIQLLVFNFFYWLYKNRIPKVTSPLLAYPLTLWMEFNKEEIKKEYFNGMSIDSQIKDYAEKLPEKMAQRISRAMMKTERRQNMDMGEWTEVVVRYTQYKNYIEDKLFIEKQLQEIETKETETIFLN